MDTQIFEKFREIIHRESGISLSEQKIALLSNRIAKRLRDLGLRQPQEYLEIIELDVEGHELVHLLDAVSTNFTNFFREGDHFRLLGEVLEKWHADKQREFKIWCAASSSGEEPYSIAITAQEHLPISSLDLKILATDICTPVLQKASQAIYEESNLRGVTPALRQKYFDLLSSQGAAKWRCNRSLRDLLIFKRLNLARFPYPLNGPLDVIFCRNVMIYFDTELRQRMVDQFFKLLRPGGYLFIGHSENFLGLKHQFERCEVSSYRKPEVD